MPRPRRNGRLSGPNVLYDWLHDRPVGFEIAAHRTTVPGLQCKLSSAASGLERRGFLRADRREPNGRQGPDGRTLYGTVYVWLGADAAETPKFSGGHINAEPRQSRDGRAGVRPRALDIVRDPLGADQPTIFDDQPPRHTDVPYSPFRATKAADLAPPEPEKEPYRAPRVRRRVFVSKTPHMALPVTPPPVFLPAAPSLSEQILLLAIQVDRARRPGTPSGAFPSDPPRPTRRGVVERLLELATLAEAMEAERRPEPAPEPVDAWRY